MENIVKVEFKGSKLHEKISKEIREYAVKEIKDCGLYLNFAEVRNDFKRQKEQIHKMTSECKEHIYSRSKAEDMAKREAQRKMRLYCGYFAPGAEDNISHEISRYYASAIVRHLEVWKRAIKFWYKVHKMSLPVQDITLHGIDGSEVIVNFNSRQQAKHNLERIIAEYINNHILGNGSYGQDFDISDIDIELESYIPMDNMDLSPFEESLRKFNGSYEAWMYNIGEQYLHEKVNEDAKSCERDFFRSGYIQDITHSIFEDFLKSVDEKIAIEGRFVA